MVYIGPRGRWDGLVEDILYAHSRGPSLGHSEEMFPILLSCKIEDTIH